MKHQQPSPLNHTLELSVDEACQMMAFLAEAVRLAAGPQVAAHKDFKGSSF